MRAPLNEAAGLQQRPHLLVIERRRSSSRSSSSCSYRSGTCCRCSGPSCLQRCAQSAVPATACPCYFSQRPTTATEYAAGPTAAATAGAAAAAAAANAAAATVTAGVAATSSCALSHIGQREPLPFPCFPHDFCENPGVRVHDRPSERFLGLKESPRCARVRSSVTQRTVNTQESRCRSSSNSNESSSLSTLEPQRLLQQQQWRRTSWQPQQPKLIYQPPQRQEGRPHAAANEGWSYPDCSSSTVASAHNRATVNQPRCWHPTAATAVAAVAASGGSASPAATYSCHRSGRARQQAASAAAAADSEEHCSSPLASAGPRARRTLHPSCSHAGGPSECEKQNRAAAAAAVAFDLAADGLEACRVPSKPGRQRRACEAPVGAAPRNSARGSYASVAVRSSRSSISPAKAQQRRRYSGDALRKLNLEPLSSRQRDSGQQALQQPHQENPRHKQHLSLQQTAQQPHQRQQQQEAIKHPINFESSFFGEATGVKDTRCSPQQQNKQQQQRVAVERLQLHGPQQGHGNIPLSKEAGADSVAKASSREAACPCAVHGAARGNAAPAAVVAARAEAGVGPCVAVATTKINFRGHTSFSKKSATPEACSSEGRQRSGQAQQQQSGQKQQRLPQLQRQQLYASAVLERLFRVLERSAYRRPWRMLLCHAAQLRRQQQQQHSTKQDELLRDQTPMELEGLSTTEEVSSIDTCMRLEVYRRRVQHQQQRRKQQQQRHREQQKQQKQQRQQLTQQLAAAAQELKKANDQQEILQERLAAALTRLKQLEQQQQQQQRGLH